MKVLVYHTDHGPTAAFLTPARGRPPASAVIPEAEALVRPAYAQVASRGPKASWEQHCRTLVSSPPYAGKWTVEEVPDSLSAHDALSRVRYAESQAGGQQ